MDVLHHDVGFEGATTAALCSLDAIDPCHFTAHAQAFACLRGAPCVWLPLIHIASQPTSHKPSFTTAVTLVKEIVAAGGAEIYRNTETDPTARCYPGGYFDPLGLADGRGADRLKEVRFLASSVSPRGFLFLLFFPVWSAQCSCQSVCG